MVFWTPIAVLVFLASSSYFTEWDGVAVSVRNSYSENPSNYEVLIVNTEGTNVTKTWDAAVVAPLNLPVDATGLPPVTMPDDLPGTKKYKYSLQFLIDVPVEEGETSGFEPFTTTSPFSLGLAVMTWILGILIRNMMYGGSPFMLERRGVSLMKAQGQTGSLQGARSRKGPPPGRKRRGVR